MKKAMGILLLSSLTLPSCSDLDEYFETPGWISGSIYQELQSSGNYSVFLKGVDLAGYQPIVNGKSILTVMAPDDNAMKEYLKNNYGTEQIEQVPESELKKLIGFHILYYSFDKDKLTNFRPVEGDGATEEDKNKLAGLYYKFRTRSQDPLSYKNEETKDTAIYHFERMLPVFSYRMFQTKNIDAKTNYEYFYPETGWKDDAGFNIANAGVTEYADIANNGYIYKIDRVLKPAETIYKELQQAGTYTRFINEYNKYGTYNVDEDLTREYGNGTTIYQHSFSSGLPNIDCEWPVNSFLNIAQLALNSYSVFAPSDKAWDDFFNDYWKEGGYESIDEVDSVAIRDILFNSVCSSSIVFPEEIKNGTVKNVSNEVISFNTDEVKNRVICTNGVLYGCDVLTPPAKYISVTGPAYQSKSYGNFAIMVNNSGMVNTLASSAVRYIMLYADNEQIETYRNIRREGSNLVDINDNVLNSSATTPYVYAHAAAPVDGDTELPMTGTKVYRTMSPDWKLYWYVKDGRITNSIKHNQRLKYTANTVTDDEIWAQFEKLAYRGDVNGWSNGNAYKYDRNFFEGSYTSDYAFSSSFLNLMWAQRTDISTEFYGFINLLGKAGMLASGGGTLSFTADACLTFIPETRVLEQAITDGRVPGIDGSAAAVGSEDFFTNCNVTDADALQYYLKQYFIPMTTAVINNYPYLGWGEKTEDLGGLITCQTDITPNPDGSTEILETKMNIYDEGTKLTIGVADRNTGAVSRRVNVSSAYDYFPFIFADGCFHFIEDVL